MLELESLFCFFIVQTLSNVKFWIDESISIRIFFLLSIFILRKKIYTLTKLIIDILALKMLILVIDTNLIEILLRHQSYCSRLRIEFDDSYLFYSSQKSEIFCSLVRGIPNTNQRQEMTWYWLLN